MSYRWIAPIALVFVAAVGVSCQQAEEAARDAGGAVEEAAAGTEDVAADLVEQGKAVAEKLDAEAKALYDKVTTELSGKQDELKALKGKIAEMSPQDLLTADGKALKGDADKLTAEIDTLKTKLQELIDQAG